MISKIILITLIALAIVHVACVEGSTGFVERFNITYDKELTSIAPFDIHRTGKLDGIIVSTKDGKVYFLDSEGKKRGMYIFKVPVYAVGSFVHDGNKKLDDALVGAYDNKVYALWSPWSDFQVPPASYWWDYDTSQHVCFLGSGDFGEYDFGYKRNKNYIFVGTEDYLGKGWKFLVLNASGYLNWGLSLPAKVTDAITFDLQSHKRTDYIAITYGNKVDVYTSTGSFVWSWSSKQKVNALSIADYDGDEALDDLIVGAGSEVYALEHDGKVVWSYDLNDTIASITTIDKDNDANIDYFLVAAGTKFYAIKNASILWSYDVGVKIYKHVSLDFERNSILDDVAFISGNSVYAYDLGRVYLPKINLSASYTKNGKNISVTFRIENLGDGNAENASFILNFSKGLNLISGETCWNGNISPKESIEIKSLFVANITGELNITGNLHYFDIYGREYSDKKTIFVVIEENKKENESKVKNESKNETSTLTSFSPPKLNIQRVVSKEVITMKENLSIDIILQNVGGSPALAITLSENVPDGFTLINRTSWKRNLEPGETRVATEIFAPKKFKKTTNVTLPEITVIYRDTRGKIYQQTIKPEKITVIVNEPFWKKYRKLAIIVVIPLLLAILKKKGKLPIKIRIIRIPKLKLKLKKPNIKIKKRKKKEKENIDLEKKFLKIYLEYQARGERPTYGDIKKQLGISIKEIDKIIDNVKKRLNLNDFSS